MPIILPDSTGVGAAFKDLQDEVLAHGFDAAVYRTRVKNYLNEAQARVARRVQIRQLEQTDFLTTTPATQTVGIPTGIIRLRSVEDTSINQNLALVQITDIDQASTSSGRPASYAISGATLLLYPTPDAAYTLQIRYWRGSTVMVDDTDVTDLPSDYGNLLISYALYRCYRSEDDVQMAQFYFTEWNRDLGQLVNDLQFPDVEPRRIPDPWHDAPLRRGWTL